MVAIFDSIVGRESPGSGCQESKSKLSLLSHRNYSSGGGRGSVNFEDLSPGLLQTTAKRNPVGLQRRGIENPQPVI